MVLEWMTMHNLFLLRFVFIVVLSFPVLPMHDDMNGSNTVTDHHNMQMYVREHVT